MLYFRHTSASAWIWRKKIIPVLLLTFSVVTELKFCFRIIIYCYTHDANSKDIYYASYT